MLHLGRFALKKYKFSDLRNIYVNSWYSALVFAFLRVSILCVCELHVCTCKNEWCYNSDAHSVNLHYLQSIE
jgi:hypothetical protein